MTQGNEFSQGESPAIVEQPQLFDALDAPVAPEDIPPLEPTADVPHVHRDDRISPAYWNDKFQAPDAEVPPEHRDDRLSEPVAGPHIVEPEIEADVEENTSRRWLKPVAAIALAGAAFGGGIIVATRGGDTEENRTPADAPELSDNISSAPLETESPEQATIEIPDTTTPDNLELDGVESSNDSGPRPDFMTAETPQELLEQFDANLECIYNSDSVTGEQLTCLELLVGNGTGDLTNLYLERIQSINNHRQQYPDYTYSFVHTLVDSRVSPREMIIVAERADAQESKIIRYTFIRDSVTVESASVEDEDMQVWVLNNENTIEPGTAYFD